MYSFQLSLLRRGVLQHFSLQLAIVFGEDNKPLHQWWTSDAGSS
jgi:hypothetical protein